MGLLARGALVDASVWMEVSRELNDHKIIHIELSLDLSAVGDAAIVIVSTDSPDAVIAIVGEHGVPARAIGRVTDAARGLVVRGAGVELESDLHSIADAYHDAIPRIMDRAPGA